MFHLRSGARGPPELLRHVTSWRLETESFSDGQPGTYTAEPCANTPKDGNTPVQRVCGQFWKVDLMLTARRQHRSSSLTAWGGIRCVVHRVSMSASALQGL